MGDVMIERLKTSIGLTGIIYLQNGFRFECKIISVDDKFIEIYDTKKCFTKLLRTEEVREVDIHG